MTNEIKKELTSVDLFVILLTHSNLPPSAYFTMKISLAFFQKAKILYAPGKASNAGGVATSGLEMTQNSLRYNWTREEVDLKLKDIMSNIHDSCIKFGKEKDGYVNYVKGANIAGFVKVADAMLAQGVV